VAIVGSATNIPEVPAACPMIRAACRAVSVLPNPIGAATISNPAPRTSPGSSAAMLACSVFGAKPGNSAPKPPSRRRNRDSPARSTRPDTGFSEPSKNDRNDTASPARGTRRSCSRTNPVWLTSQSASTTNPAIHAASTTGNATGLGGSRTSASTSTIAARSRSQTGSCPKSP